MIDKGLARHLANQVIQFGMCVYPLEHLKRAQTRGWDEYVDELRKKVVT